MSCTCDRDGYPCPEHYAGYVQSYEEAAERVAEVERREHEAGIYHCPRCGRQADPDLDCHRPECRDYFRREAFLAWVKPDAWREDEPAGPCPGHEWGEPEVEADGGDVDARRACKLCGRVERQRLVSEPEAPNCYVPGEGRRVI